MTATTALWLHLKMDPSILAPRPAAAASKMAGNLFSRSPKWKTHTLLALEISPQLDPVFAPPVGSSIWIMAAAIPPKKGNGLDPRELE